MNDIEKAELALATAKKRLADAKEKAKKQAREKVVRAAEKAGLFALPVDVLEREFLAIAERNKS